ncbi:MAG TPA: serine hydrolase domain-containing protein [Acidimicrobiales bacterium]|nr:serine hydrolase domain-containing protein [Acidimicrobiales bacterium]
MKVDPDGAGLDAKQLARIGEHLQARYIEPGKITGCQVTVARQGVVGYFESFGEMDREAAKPTADDTIYRLFSMTKPIAGVALMKLYEQGHFQLGDPVHRWIPEWKNLKVKTPDGLVDQVRPMSVKDCLMHTTGLGWGIDGELTMDKFLPAMTALRGGDKGTLEGLTEQLARFPLEFQPGTKWLYGLSTDICGRLVECMSGLRFDEFLKQEIFEPLGMVDTDFYVPVDKRDRLAANYIRTGKKELRQLDGQFAAVNTSTPSFLSGGGGLLGTSADYLRFAQMLCNGGELDGVRILGRKTVELMTQNHIPGGGDLQSFHVDGSYGETGFEGVGFGLTMAVGLGPVATASIGSAGDFYWGGAASTIFWVDPAEELVVVFMTQMMPSGTFNFRGQLKSLVYPAIL